MILCWVTIMADNGIFASQDLESFQEWKDLRSSSLIPAVMIIERWNISRISFLPAQVGDCVGSPPYNTFQIVSGQTILPYYPYYHTTILPYYHTIILTYLTVISKAKPNHTKPYQTILNHTCTLFSGSRLCGARQPDGQLPFAWGKWVGRPCHNKM